ncbi:glycine zipper 2TM domain-containing protein [Croceicoccus ponticola]|uniref:17 kDa surface antigen n=1 Tax=Croceicoccus ponticola TaxID=2217664 RepID=A0A437H1P5_9SPHN|nr:glycine zipper 2TM domain-containing protein [Croceicoccus ponticola]RVQ69550.1 glycine zipper 2TM domain-containing protein [Croceicoccus ponticola]
MSRSLLFRTGLLAAAVPALALGAPVAQAAHYDAPVAAAYEHESVSHSRDRDRYREHDRYGRYDDRYGRYESRDRYESRRYNTRDSYRGDRVNRDTRVWRGDDGRYYCKRDNGTTGLLIGGAVGGMIGNEVARDRTLGAILGAAGGALLGREIDRGGSRCR